MELSEQDSPVAVIVCRGCPVRLHLRCLENTRRDLRIRIIGLTPQFETGLPQTSTIEFVAGTGGEFPVISDRGKQLGLIVVR